MLLSGAATCALLGYYCMSVKKELPATDGMSLDEVNAAIKQLHMEWD